jgi:PadR family transcriptional regulator PadR
MAEILGTFEQAVLLGTLRLGKKAYGRAIVREMEAALDRNVVAGAVYATLNRLEDQGYVVSRAGESVGERRGRPRRYFRLTAPGARALNQAKTTLEKMWTTVSWPVRSRR